MSTGVLPLLTPDDNRQMQILDRTGILQALDLTADGLIKLYALVESGITNGLDIDVVKISTFFNVRISHIFIGPRRILIAGLVIVQFVSRSLMQSLYSCALWVPTLILAVLSCIHS